MSAMSDAVKNGPRATSAKVAHIEAQIRLHEAKERKARDQSTAHRRRANGDGPLAKSRRIRADAQATVADRHRAKANQLRADLAKAKAAETARNLKHVKRTVASTAAEGLVPKQQAQPARPGRAKAGQVAKPTGAGGGQAQPAAPKTTPTATKGSTPMSTHGLGPDERNGLGAGLASGDWSPKQWAEFRKQTTPPPMPKGGTSMTASPGHLSRPKGTPAMTVSGEAVNIEQTRAMLAQIKTQVGELRGSMEGASGSLASGGLNKLAGAFASADDPLDSVLSELDTADKHLADQEAIAEAAQAAGEMHGDKAFYGA